MPRALNDLAGHLSDRNRPGLHVTAMQLLSSWGYYVVLSKLGNELIDLRLTLNT